MVAWRTTLGAAILVLLLASCESQLEKHRRESGDKMITIWNTLHYVAELEGDAFAMPGGIEELRAVLAANQEYRQVCQDVGKALVVTESPLVADAPEVDRPHYRLLAESLDLPPTEAVLVENPALYDRRGAQVCRAGGDVDWVEGERARELWERGR